MLFNSLTDIPCITLLRSDKMLMALMQADTSQDNLSDAHFDSIRDFYPNTFRKGAMKLAVRATNAHTANVLDYGYDCLGQLFSQYFDYDGSHIEAKEEELERYSALINKIHPYNIIGYQLAYNLINDTISMKNIDIYASSITSLGFSNHRDLKRYSDNHLHLGGANENIPNLLELLNNPTDPGWYDPDTLNNMPRINMFSHINNGQLTLGNLIDIAKTAQSVIHASIVENSNDSDNASCIFQRILNGYTIPPTDLSSYTFDFMHKSRICSSWNFVPVQMLLSQTVKHFSENEPLKQWFVYNVLLHYIHLESTFSSLKKMVKIFFHATNIIRSYQVMNQNIGLSHFSEFSRSKIRQTSTSVFRNVASAIIDNGTQTFEAKISPSVARNETLIEFMKAFDDRISIKQKHFPKMDLDYHFSIHFLRRDDPSCKSIDSLSCNYRHQKLRNDLKKEALKLHAFLYEQVPIKKIENPFKNSEEQKYIDISKLITSIDVAGDETLSPPEVFAPIIRFLRSEPKKIPMEDYRNHLMKLPHGVHRKLCLSIHAGEDFNHIVTGMRRIDETMAYYEMHKNDRLGHALAIGLIPNEWIIQNGDIFMTKLELLDNYIWLIKKGAKVVGHHQSFPATIERYNNFAYELIQQIYGENHTISELYEAWKLRQYCPIETFSTVQALNSPYLKAAKVPAGFSENVKRIFNIYHTNPTFRKKGDESIIIRYSQKNKQNDYSYINDDDLKFYHALQDLLIEEVSNKEIIIEANPTSNVYIAQLNSFDKHPIFRWHPINDDITGYNEYGIRNAPVKVCVNTDDPAIMPTTLRNEFHILKNAALNFYPNPKEVEKWLEEIRLLGNDIFDYNHQKYKFSS